MEDPIHPTVDEMVEKEMQKIKDREAQVEDRVTYLDSIHEDIVIMNRLGNLEDLTFLELTEKTITHRQRSSWYGKVLKISDVDSGDAIRTFKKNKLKVGDIVSFNPDSAYSLNVANFDEIWTLHIDNVLITDRAYNYLEARKENLRKRLTIQQNVKMRIAEEEQAKIKLHNINQGIKKNS